MRGIERQSEYYGFVDPEIARFAAEREASQEIPADAEVESFLSGPRITAGMLDDRRGGGTRSFSRGPALEGGRAGSRVTARGYGSSPVPGQDYQIGDRVKLTDPREVVTVTEIDFDPSDPMSSTIEYEDDNGDPGYAYGRDVFRTAAADR